MPIPRKDINFAGDRVQVNMLDVNWVVRCADLRQFVRFTKVNRLAEARHKAENTLLILGSDSAATGARCGTYVIYWGWRKIGGSDGGYVGGGDSRGSERLRITIRFHQRAF